MYFSAIQILAHYILYHKKHECQSKYGKKLDQKFFARDDVTLTKKIVLGTKVPRTIYLGKRL